MTKAFVVGHPVAHSRSPLIHGHWLAQHGVGGSYERAEVSPDEFPSFIRGLREAGFAGGNVTVPHKEAAFRLADDVTEHARRLGAVNTVWFDEQGRLCGDNTDGHGFLAHLDATLDHWATPETRTALVLGAGGAARAIVAALLDRDLDRVVLANRTERNAYDVARLDESRVTVVPWEAASGSLRDVDLLVNTTQLGMAGQPPLALALDTLRDRAIVIDVVYVPLETPLLAAARARGLRALDGLGMLLHQAVPGFERWFGIRPAVTPELRALVAADLERHP